MASFKIVFAVGVILCVALLESTLAVKRHHDELRKRSIGAAPGQEQNKKDDKEPDWKPAEGPREFSVDVDDKIKGASQHRHEKWQNGTVTGEYAAPNGRNGKWLKYEYIGDKNGFRITKTTEVTPEELMTGYGPSAKDHQANVNIKADQSTPVQYTVTEQLQVKDKTTNDKKEKDKQ